MYGCRACVAWIASPFARQSAHHTETPLRVPVLPMRLGRDGNVGSCWLMPL